MAVVVITDEAKATAECGIDVSYETVRRWALKFGGIIALKLRRGRHRPDGRWHLDEVFVRLACR
jgi:putative transposase